MSKQSAQIKQVISSLSDLKEITIEELEAARDEVREAASSSEDNKLSSLAIDLVVCIDKLKLLMLEVAEGDFMQQMNQQAKREAATRIKRQSAFCLQHITPAYKDFPSFDRLYESYAAKFMAETVSAEYPKYEEPSDINLSKRLSNCCRPARSHEYSAIRQALSCAREWLIGGRQSCYSLEEFKLIDNTYLI